jgi:transposase
MTTNISMLAIDLAKGSFQVCAVGPEGTVLYNRSLSRTRLATLLADQPACIVAMEACATSHHWGRVAQRYGHEVRLVPAAYVKPFVKRQKNDKADAEAIAEAALRPTMRFVALKSAETQGRAVAFRTHQCLVRQRTQLINALRGHLAEFGLVAPKGPASLKVLENALEDEATDLPCPVREMGTIYLSQIARLTEVIEQLADELETASKTDAQLRRLCTIPGVGPVTAGAVSAFAPDLDTFDSGRNFAAWLGRDARTATALEEHLLSDRIDVAASDAVLASIRSSCSACHAAPPRRRRQDPPCSGRGAATPRGGADSIPLDSPRGNASEVGWGGGRKNATLDALI